MIGGDGRVMGTVSSHETAALVEFIPMQSIGTREALKVSLVKSFM
jgi:hypothetical protein